MAEDNIKARLLQKTERAAKILKAEAANGLAERMCLTEFWLGNRGSSTRFDQRRSSGSNLIGETTSTHDEEENDENDDNFYHERGGMQNTRAQTSCPLYIARHVGHIR
ncbi:uncharacterized protein PHALS_10100 [Plasmopara halstedii]|uniref:Uncharacterized protein n=1 Tax=Plasmopara halstedii TaxID=4781 RepID=A0A0P1AGY2_PLAHL|nr:uncharacterized protein PHALS_10100 [Plasmopara halstedii]CEG39870.1 hypothetical protein PHALS_10100 [Plasmopara halstedii]|eukprot:XP_024576239.1 hypothetical protein PHALS_10100 [Plasmopara halstedii]